MGGWEDGRMG
jgi:hypothetical protein